MSNLVILSTAAHEVDNLDPIIVAKHSLAPLTTSHDFAIEFNRNSRRGQIELSD